MVASWGHTQDGGFKACLDLPAFFACVREHISRLGLSSCAPGCSLRHALGVPETHQGSLPGLTVGSEACSLCDGAWQVFWCSEERGLGSREVCLEGKRGCDAGRRHYGGWGVLGGVSGFAQESVGCGRRHRKWPEESSFRHTCLCPQLCWTSPAVWGTALRFRRLGPKLLLCAQPALSGHSADPYSFPFFVAFFILTFAVLSFPFSYALPSKFIHPANSTPAGLLTTDWEPDVS